MCRDFEIFVYSWKAYKALQRFEERCREKRCCGWENSVGENTLLGLMNHIEYKAFEALTHKPLDWLGNCKNAEGFLVDKWFEVFYLSVDLEDAMRRLESMYVDAYIAVEKEYE